MNNLVARLTGRDVIESVPVPVGTVRQPSLRNRGQRVRQRTAAAMMGMSEGADDDSIIPDDAAAIEGADSGVQIDMDQVRQDQEPAAATVPASASAAAQGEPLLTPRSALVAPDVTPEVDVALDTSEVPAPPEQARQHAPQPNGNDAALNVLLGRSSSPAQATPAPEQVVTAEAAQATVNTLLSAGVSGDALLRAKQPMPDPAPANTAKIMEAFQRFGPKQRGFG